MKLHTVVLALLVCLFQSDLSFGEVVFLKSGKVIDGEIVEKAKDYIKVKYNGLEVYYENKYIQKIESQGPDSALTQSKQAYEVPDTSAATAAYLKKGLELASQEDFQRAEAEFRREIIDINGALGILDDLKNGLISKEYAVSLFQSSLYLMDGENKKAIAVLEKAWEINPKDPDVNYNLGAAWFSLKDYQRAVFYLFAALKLRPEDTQAHELIAKAYYNLGQYEKAKESFSAARSLYE